MRNLRPFLRLVALFGLLPLSAHALITRQPPPPTTPPPATLQADPKRVEESNTTRVKFTGNWAPADASWGWSGGTARQSSTAGATVSITFTGTSVRWIGARGRNMGIALVSVDGVLREEVNLAALPTDIIHTPIITINDLKYGTHTLKITVAGRGDVSPLVVVDAFDIEPNTTVSHLQDTDPNMQFSGGWTKSSLNWPWSGSGMANAPELPVTAQETETAGATLKLPFRGTGVVWIGYRGPDAGIAQVRVDNGATKEVDLYAPTATYQPIVFRALGLADAKHTLTITATGRKNVRSSAARVVVDAVDVINPGRRYEEDERAITYSTPPGTYWTQDHQGRVWSGGAAATSNVFGATATFRFTGTSVSWIGCMKGSAGGTVDVFIDGVFREQVNLHKDYPIEGYQMTVFRADGLLRRPHTIELKVVSTNGAYVVVDAFDVR